MLSLKSIKSQKERDRLGVFVVEGLKFVGEIPSDWKVLAYVVQGGFKGSLDQYKKRAPCIQVSEKTFAGIAEASTPQGILAIVEKKYHTPAEIFAMANARKVGAKFLLLLESMSDPGNAGSLVRTACAAGAAGVVFTQGSAGHFRPKTQRASAGMALRIPIASDVEIQKVLRLAEIHALPIYAAHAKAGKLPQHVDFTAPFCLALGSESRGLSPVLQSAAKSLMRLPMAGGMDSLSAAAAGAVLMYEAVRQNMK